MEMLDCPHLLKGLEMEPELLRMRCRDALVRAKEDGKVPYVHWTKGTDVTNKQISQFVKSESMVLGIERVEALAAALESEGWLRPHTSSVVERDSSSAEEERLRKLAETIERLAKDLVDETYPPTERRETLEKRLNYLLDSFRESQAGRK